MLLEIQNDSGHTTTEAKVESVLEQINDYPNHWVIIDGVMTARELISDVNWETVEHVLLQEQVQGGC